MYSLTGDGISQKLIELSEISSSASEIDGKLAFIADSKAQKFLNHLKGADSIGLVGDSISQLGQENYTTLLSDRINNKIASKNIGRVSAYEDLTYFHKTTFSNFADWTENLSSPTALTSYVVSTSIPNTTISFTSPSKGQTKARIVYLKQLVDCSFEIYVNNVLKTTINDTANGVVSESVTPYFSLDLKSNIIKCVVKTGTVAISAVDYVENENNPSFHVLATAGRRTNLMSTDTVDKICSDYDILMFALGYNDISNYWDEATKASSLSVLNRFFTKITEAGKFIVFMNFCWNTLEEDNWYMSEIRDFCSSYPNSIFLEYNKTITKSDGSLADSTYRINTLREWSDEAHPNQSGDIRLNDYIVNSLSLNLIDITRDDTEKTIYGTSIRYGNTNPTLLSTRFSRAIGELNAVSGDFAFALGRSNTVGQHSFVSGYSNIDTGSYNFISGYKNNSKKSYSSVMGVRGVSTLIGSTIASSRTDNKINQITTHIRDVKTTNATEVYLRDFDYTATMTTNSNTNIFIKSTITAISDDLSINEVYEVISIFQNVSGTVTLLKENIVHTVGSNSSLQIKSYGGSSNACSIRVTGDASKTVRWFAKMEVMEQSLDY